MFLANARGRTAIHIHLGMELYDSAWPSPLQRVITQGPADPAAASPLTAAVLPLTLVSNQGTIILPHKIKI
jgi:hypothetical protein